VSIPNVTFSSLVAGSALLLATFAAIALAQAAAGPPLAFSECGFRYTPPSTLQDETASDREFVKQKAAALHATKVLTVALSLESVSGEDSQWCRIGIESYPREKLADLTDAAAILKVSRWVAGAGSEVGEPKQTKAGQFRFTVSTFELHENQLVKHAAIDTAILRKQVVSFAFSAKSLEVLSKIEASINSLEPLLSQ
jgi:hypothetical protein